MESSPNTKITLPYLKQDAIVAIKLGTGYIQYLQLALSVILKDKDTTGLQEKLKENTKLEDWEQSAVALSQLLKYIFELAEEQGMIIEKEVDLMSLPQNDQ
jgi:hypothetical protein